jgi:uncharacterized UBP type Zn finger protein
VSWVVDSDASGRPPARACGHLVQLPSDLSPRCVRGCEDCLELGRTWVHLRECVTCGYVGCCDESPLRHATVHHRATAHPLIRSLQPGQAWAWCYPDRVRLMAITPQPGQS